MTIIDVLLVYSIPDTNIDLLLIFEPLDLLFVNYKAQ